MTPSLRDAVIRPVEIADLRPTQITVGFREVERKQRKWEREKKKADELREHLVPVVLGPDGARYIIDNHHLARALWNAGQRVMHIRVVGDLTKAGEKQFWNLMDFHGWTHPFDETGRRRPYDEIPQAIADMRNDPFRSLAGALRREGGFAKDSTPYSEFVWADFFRHQAAFKARDIDGDKFDRLLEKALEAAKSKDADYLPGWCGKA